MVRMVVVGGVGRRRAGHGRQRRRTGGQHGGGGAVTTTTTTTAQYLLLQLDLDANVFPLLLNVQQFLAQIVAYSQQQQILLLQLLQHVRHDGRRVVRFKPDLPQAVAQRGNALIVVAAAPAAAGQHRTGRVDAARCDQRRLLRLGRLGTAGSRRRCRYQPSVGVRLTVHLERAVARLMHDERFRQRAGTAWCGMVCHVAGRIKMDRCDVARITD